MATSDIQLIPYILSNVGQVKFESLLDVGMGFGKYGHLIRDYKDLMVAETPKEFARERWRLRIDGIEAFPEFITDRQHASYDNIYIGDAREILSSRGQYDIIILIATLIHMSREDGMNLIRTMYEHCNKFVLFTAPPVVLPQDDVFGNPYEVHHDVVWKPEDLTEFPKVVYGNTFNNKAQVFMLPKPGVNIKFIDLFAPTPFVTRMRPYVKAVVGERIARKIGAIVHRRERAENG